MIYKKENLYQIWSNIDFNVDTFFSEILEQGKIIKQTSKTSSFQWNTYFVKKTNYPLVEGIFRHLFLPHRCRNAWEIGNFLVNHQILTPRPIAYIELLKFSFPYQHFFISEYLFDSYNVEEFIKKNIHIEKGIDLNDFFHSLKNLLIHLWEHGIYHRDLSGKNLLTKDGRDIYLIDLDSMHLINPIHMKYKIRNLIQIYDSFCDFVDEVILKDFIFSVSDYLSIKDLEKIFVMVQIGQKQRRHQHQQHLRRYTGSK